MSEDKPHTSCTTLFPQPPAYRAGDVGRIGAMFKVEGEELAYRSFRSFLYQLSDRRLS